jgi:hypothetical protein
VSLRTILLYHLSTKEAVGNADNAFWSYSAVVHGRYKLPTYSDYPLVLLRIACSALKRNSVRALLNFYFSHFVREKSDSAVAVLGDTVARQPAKSRRSVIFSPSKCQTSANFEPSVQLSRQLSRFALSDTPTPDLDAGSRSLSQLLCRTPEGTLGAFAPAIGASSAESRGRLGSLVGPAPAAILGGIAAGTFPETVVHLPRGFCFYSGLLLYCSGACEGCCQTP